MAVGGDVRFSDSPRPFTEKDDIEKCFIPCPAELGAAAMTMSGANREETYNSLRAITISVYRVVLRAWHEKSSFGNAVRPPFVCGRVNRQTYEKGARQRGVRADDSASAGSEILKENKTRTETSLRLRHPRKISLP